MCVSPPSGPPFTRPALNISNQLLSPSLEHHVPLMILLDIGEAGGTSGGISGRDGEAGAGAI